MQFQRWKSRILVHLSVFNSNSLSKLLVSSRIHYQYRRKNQCVISSKFIHYKGYLINLGYSNAGSLLIHRNWSVCNDRVDKVSTLLTSSWNVYILRHRYTSSHSVQVPELLAILGTFQHSLLDHPSHTEQLHLKILSSVSATERLHFLPPPQWSSKKLPPKRLLAP